MSPNLLILGKAFVADLNGSSGSEVNLNSFVKNTKNNLDVETRMRRVPRCPGSTAFQT